MLLAGLRRQHTMAGAGTSVPEQWNEFRSLGSIDASGRTVYGAICGSDGDGFEYMTGVQVDSFDGVGEDVGRMRVPAQEYAVFTHRGRISEVSALWQHIWRDWLPRSGYEDAETPPLERYGSGFNAEMGDGEFEIWFPVRRSQQAEPSRGA